MKTDWEFLTKTIYDPAIFWGMVTAFATVFLALFAVFPLRDLARTRRTELAWRLRENFWTPRMQAIMYLIDHGLLDYEPTPLPPSFAFPRINDDPGQSFVSEHLGDRIVLSAFEIDDQLLNPLVDIALSASVGSITFEDVHALFGNAIKSTAEDPAIQAHIRDMRRNPRFSKAWIEIERIIPKLDEIDKKLEKRTQKLRSAE
jgi:hypothetical protein